MGLSEVILLIFVLSKLSDIGFKRFSRGGVEITEDGEVLLDRNRIARAAGLSILSSYTSTLGFILTISFFLTKLL